MVLVRTDRWLDFRTSFSTMQTLWTPRSAEGVGPPRSRHRTTVVRLQADVVQLRLNNLSHACEALTSSGVAMHSSGNRDSTHRIRHV
jgi:hypothetical protein